ncbi:hypothetical protein [Rhodopseudomonas sp. B29]|nr:hypothetical protein [Rhodopseudomonas sp. B29]
MSFVLRAITADIFLRAQDARVANDQRARDVRFRIDTEWTHSEVDERLVL